MFRVRTQHVSERKILTTLQMGKMAKLFFGVLKMLSHDE